MADRGLKILTCVASVAFVQIAAAQESPTPSPPGTAEESASSSVSPQTSPPPSPIPAQTTSPASSRSVRISFVPPPLEGTISLGIYDKTGKLVRVLHQNAQLNDFTIGADAIVTRWDGRNDAGQDLPAGQYHVRGYLIGALRLENLGNTLPPAMDNQTNSVVKVRLVRNPLRKDKKPAVELGVGFGARGSYLETTDGLPLFKISETPNVAHASIAAKAENAVDVWQDEGREPHQFRISKVDQMMAFDCGDFELN
jgi:hypothetical protein